jgi:hypothetical protein
MKQYYASRVKEEYNRRYIVAKKLYDDATEEERESKAVKKPVPVQLRSEIGREFWDLETAEFRQEMTEKAEDAYLKEVEEWEEAKTVPKTPQQFHQ